MKTRATRRPGTEQTPNAPLPPGTYRLSDMADVVATLRAKGVQINGMTWDNRVSGAPTLWVERGPDETRAG
jgi:hypothetical protein